MFKKFLILSLSTMLIVSSANSASDGDLVMAKNNPTEVKDCFESVNRASFAFNQVLDGVIFKPVSSVMINQKTVDKDSTTPPLVLIPSSGPI